MSDSRATYDPTSPESLAVPTDPSKRLELVDALRGFALLGILIVNLGDFTLHWGLSAEQRAMLSTASTDETAQFLYWVFGNGKFNTIFSLLFGLGFAMFIARGTRGDAAFLTFFRRRLSVLFLIGAVHMAFIWWGDIVAMYAAIGFVLILFRHLSVRCCILLVVGAPRDAQSPRSSRARGQSCSHCLSVAVANLHRTLLRHWSRIRRAGRSNAFPPNCRSDFCRPGRAEHPVAPVFPLWPRRMAVAVIHIREARTSGKNQCVKGEAIMKSTNHMKPLWIAFSLLAASPAATQERLPIIDMHLHASSPDGFGGPQTVCTNREWVEFPPVDPREEATVQKTSTCSTPLMSARDGDENARQTGEMMKKYNIYGVLDVSRDGEGAEASLAHGNEWRRYAPGRYWIALDFSDIGLPPLDDLEALVRDGRIQLFAEISPQYDGEKPTAQQLEPYFALAERLDVPVGLHLGEGPPGGASVMPSSEYSVAAGRPLDLEPLLRRHPELRIYVMHYGSPLVEEMIALLYAHANLYVDVAQNNWGFPRAHFYRQLQQLVDAGFGKRIMFGSDQMIWPETIPIAIEAIEQAPFLTEDQKRDILYNNAARFLRLSEEETARHHGK